MNGTPKDVDRKTPARTNMAKYNVTFTGVQFHMKKQGGVYLMVLQNRPGTVSASLGSVFGKAVLKNWLAH